MRCRFLAILLPMCAAVAAAGAAEEALSAPQSSPASLVLKPIPQPATTKYSRLQPRLQPSARTWVQQQASVERRRAAPDVPALEAAIKSRFTAAGAGSGADIEALAFIVLMQATNDMDKDLQQIMAQVKAMNEAKQKLRSLLQEVQKETAANAGKSPAAPCGTPLCRSLQRRAGEITTAAANGGHPIRLDTSGPLTNARLKQIEGDLSRASSDLDEISQSDQLQLQMLMDQRTKFVETLSNILKKISTTDDSIVQNLK